MRTGRGARCAAALVASALIVLSPAIAEASTVSITDGTLSYSAGLDEFNDLAVSIVGDEYDLIDAAGVVITASGGCQAIAPNHARCPAAAVTIVDIALADERDLLTITDSASPTGFVQLAARGGPGPDELTGGAGDETLYGGSDGDVVSGGAGSDTIIGPAHPLEFDPLEDGDDDLDGGPGEDVVVDGGPGNDTVSGGDGVDLAVLGGEGEDTVGGGDGDDENVVGGPGDDVLVDGGAGDDEVYGGPGDDTVRGGEGADNVEVGLDASGRPDPGALDGSDSADGGPGDDRLGVEAAGEPLSGDVLGGGGGVDTLSYAPRLLPVQVIMDGLPNDGAAGEGDNVLADVERLTGGAESDTLVGGAGAEQIDGGPGDDLIAGGGGDDRLDGGANDGGSDSLIGGAGVDTMQGGPGDDSLEGGDGDDGIRGGGGSDALAGDGGQDDLAGGPGLDTVGGGDGDDVLRGGDALLIGADGADALDGGAGDDELLGGPGNDVLDGGFGADRIGGEAGRDTVTYDTRSARVTVTFDDLPNDGEADENDNVASDVEEVRGSAAADTLTGDQRDNVLAGGSGEDWVKGLAGGDNLRGGTAPDVVDARDGERDTVDCGPGGDLAILDRGDSVRNCEHTDRVGRHRPALGRTALVARTVGNAAFRLPNARRYAPLEQSLKLPLGMTIDARTARVRLTTARNRSARQRAVFARGLFSVRQRRRITSIRLRGGDFSACRQRSAGAARAASAGPLRRAIRRLWGRGRGRYRTRGRHSSGVVRGTTWLTVDRCDGTLTRVITGTVVVRDFTLRRTVVVRAGEQYLARAPGGR